MHLPAQVQYAFAVVGMQLSHPEIQHLKTVGLVGGYAAQVAPAVVDVGDAFVEVHLVERQAGEFGTRRQARLALQQPLHVALAGERGGEDLCDQLQPLHQRIRPVALRSQAVQPECANGRLVPDRERKGYG